MNIETKSQPIDYYRVAEAYRQVKRGGKAAGVDGQSMLDFEIRLNDNLYKLWNRMTSGSYMPPPIRAHEISKSDGTKRKLGIPTVGGYSGDTDPSSGDVDPLGGSRFKELDGLTILPFFS